MDWRKNIHATLQALNKGWETGIPLLVIDAIDSAWLAGLEDNATALQKGREEVIEAIPNRLVFPTEGTGIKLKLPSGVERSMGDGNALKQYLREKFSLEESK